MSKVEQLGLDWAVQSLDGDQWIQFLEDEVRQHRESATEWEQHRSRWQGQDSPEARYASGFADPSDGTPRTLTPVDSLHERLRPVLTPPLFNPQAELGFLQEVAAASQTASTPVPAFRQGVEASQELMKAAVEPDAPTAYIPSLEEEQLRHQIIKLDLPFEPEFLPAQKQAAAEAAHAAIRGEGAQPPQAAPSADQVPGDQGFKTVAVQPEPLLRAAVEGLAPEIPPGRSEDSPILLALRETWQAAPGFRAGTSIVSLVTQPASAPDFKQALGAIVEAVRVACGVDVRSAVQAGMLSGQALTEPVHKAAVLDIPPELVSEKPAAAPAPAPAPVATVTTTAPPLPVATPTPTPAAAPAPATASTPTPALTPAQVDVLKGAWAAVGTDPYQVLKWLDEYGINAAQFAQAVGTTEQNVADALTLMGASHGYGSALTLSREELNADFEAQLRAAVQANGGTIDLNAFVRDYMLRDTAASRQFARLHGAMQFNRQESTPDQFDEGALVVKGQAGMQTVTFGTGYTIRVGEGPATVRLTQWEPNQQVQQHMATPKVSQAERQAILADYGKQNEKLLQVYGANETLPDNEVTRLLKIKYGEAVATLMYRVDKAMERARNDYIGGVQGAMEAGSGRGWVERTKTVVDESGPHEVKTQEFDVRAFHAAITSGADPKSQVLKELFGELQEHNGEFTIRGQGGVQHFSVSYSESGQPSLQVGQLEAPEGTRKIDLANPPKLKNAAAVEYIPGVGFVTEISNIIPPKKKKNKWKMALSIVATVAVVAVTAGTAAPAVCGALGLTGAGATVAGTIAAGAITGAMTAAASTITSGLILNGRVDSKALLKGMVAGAITGALFTPPPAGADAAAAGAGVASAGATASGLTKNLVNRMLVQGAISKAQGGKFASGALSAAAADVGQFVDANVADALKNSALGSVAGELGKAAGSLAKAGVSSGGHGGERFWSSVANDIGELARPYVTPKPEAAPRPAPQVDPLEQASPPPDLYDSHDQWASDNQQALEDDQRAQQRAQEEARSSAQSSFRQSELEAQQKPFRLTPPDLDNWSLPSATPVNGQVGTPTLMRAGNYAGSVELMVKAHLGPNATRQEINRGVAQTLEINGIINPRAIQPHEILQMPDASTQAPSWGLQVRDRDNAIGLQIQAQREAARSEQNRGMSVVKMPSTGDSRSFEAQSEPGPKPIGSSEPDWRKTQANIDTALNGPQARQQSVDQQKHVLNELINARQALPSDAQAVEWLRDGKISPETYGKLINDRESLGTAIRAQYSTAKSSGAIPYGLYPEEMAGYAGGGISFARGAGSMGTRSSGRPSFVEPEFTPAERISQRTADNEMLRNGPQFPEDMAKVGVTENHIVSMFEKKSPLGFQDAQQFERFKSELNTAIGKSGLNDAEVGLKGTATTFYSENPSKPLGHHWDADRTNPGDYDLNIHSKKMVEKFTGAGISINKKYGIFKTRDVNLSFPELDSFRIKWSTELGRDVNFVGLPSAPTRDKTEYILSKQK